MSGSYAERVSAEIRNFDAALASGGVTHSIAPIFTYWACKYLSPRLINIYGTADIPVLFGNEMLRYAEKSKKEMLRVLSLGSGDCEFETSIHKNVAGRVKLNWECTDLNPAVSASAKDRADSMGYGEQFNFHIIDLNEDFVHGQFDIIMINHSLHHFIGLEHIFSNIKDNLVPHGRILISDMIGRNGHMRWPEALGIVDSLWRFLPEKYHFNNHSRCLEKNFINYDCTTGGDFEGVRAQDILPLLLKDFYFERFVGFGNVMDIFTDRTYGHNFNVDSEFDTSFIDYVERLNTELIDRGIVKPTIMIGTLSITPVECTFDRWSPQFSMRRPD